VREATSHAASYNRHMLTTRCRHRFAGFLLACWAASRRWPGHPFPARWKRICSAQAPGQWRLVLPLDAPEAPSSVHAPDCLLCLPPLWLAPPAAHAMVLAPASAAPAAPRREPWALAMVGALPQARAPLKCYKNNSYQRLMIGR
jgi:hypothetical protein